MQQSASVPRRVLIVRLSAIGDIVVSTGLISSLRTLYPHAHLAWLCEPMGAPLLSHNPRLDELIIWPKAEWKALRKAGRWQELWHAISTFRQDLKSRQFDLVVDPQGLLKSGVMGWFTGAPRRVAAFAREGSHLLCHERTVPPTVSAPLIGYEARHLAHYLGAPPDSYRLDLAVGQAPLERVQTLMPGTGRPKVALCPFTTRPQKHWVEERWAPLARQLINTGFEPVLLGGPGDVEAGQRMAKAEPGITNLVGQLRLDETVAAISLCQGLIGVDTGLTHMGTALGLPTVALFGSTCPYTQGQDQMTRVLYDALPCSPCHRKPTCQGAFTCMSGITLERVLKSFAELFNLSAAAP